MNTLIGETAALTTAFCWAFTAIFFTIGGERVGSVVVNRIRLVMALLFLSTTHFIIHGQPLPFEAEPKRWLWLGLSSILGLVLGDSMLFQALVIIGPRVSMLLMSLVPVISTAIAWVSLGERLAFRELLAISITLGGISWVVADKHKDPVRVRGRRLALGIVLAAGGAFGQASGLVASKKGMEGGFPALSANLIRMMVAVGIMWTIALILGKAVSTLRHLRDTTAGGAIMAGAASGPFLGVWLSLVAIDNAPIGIASTLMTTTPIILVPLVHWIFKERITMHAVMGTLVAAAGVSMLILL